MDTKELLDYALLTTEKAAIKMRAKNHDYGSSWEEMRPESITDQILVKVRRIIQLEELYKTGDHALVAEGISEELIDIINYAIMRYYKEEHLDRQSN